MENEVCERQKRRRKRRLWLIPVSLLLALAVGFLIYAGVYYHADETALAALESDGTAVVSGTDISQRLAPSEGAVEVARTDFGWRFDGPSETEALIFYPGAKVEAAAYAPLLRELAGAGMDVLLVEMPLRFAFLGMNKAASLIEQYDYVNWYVGGHSLGGAVAANYACAHPEGLAGVILLAAYPTKPMDDSLVLISVYGSEDGVLSLDKVAAGRAYAPKTCAEYVIEGGNHAQFGSYGPQTGDGAASISPEEQWRQTAEAILTYKR